MDDNDFKSVRKNLNIISVLILLLAFSNAEINKINILGISLELEGTKLFVGLYFIYAYFIWRFITKLPYRKEFLKDLHMYLYESLDGLSKYYTLERMQKEFEATSDDYRERSKNGTAHARKIGIGHEAGSLRKVTLSLDYSRTLTKEEREDHSTSQSNRISIEKKVSLQLVLRKTIWFCIKYDKFGDYIFPFIPILANTLFFFLSSKWQGGFYELILK
ncbi:MAG: hypothetical protein ABJG78_02940 [Cyclobacteriaceae bacterium]